MTEASKTGNWATQSLAKQRLEGEQRETEAELRRHKEHLEQIVSERTAQLKDANLRLGQEVENHEEARVHAEQANRAKTAFLAAMSHEVAGVKSKNSEQVVTAMMASDVAPVDASPSG